MLWVPNVLWAVSCCAGAGLILAGAGTQAGLWGFRTGFKVLEWSAYFGLASAGAALGYAMGRKEEASEKLWILLGAGVIGLSVALVPWTLRRNARSFPPIHDITTDVVDPPLFKDLLAERKGAPNASEYGGPEIAAQQGKAYPDLKTVTLLVPPNLAFRKVLDAVEAAGWKLAAFDVKDGRIEATAATYWFGFKDDIVVRIRPEASGSRIDIRSVSRVGKGDAGVNAKRIRWLVARLKA